jgi:hypothetical protein
MPLCAKCLTEPGPLEGPVSNYCRKLEAHTLEQSLEIEALRQMLQSEHDRHMRAVVPRLRSTEPRLTQVWHRARARLVSTVAWVRRDVRSNGSRQQVIRPS